MPTFNSRQIYLALGLTTCAAMAKVALTKWKKSLRRPGERDDRYNLPLPLDEVEEEKAIALLRPSFHQAASLVRTYLSDRNGNANASANANANANANVNANTKIPITPTDQLMLYGLYKQASLGNANEGQAPSKLNLYATKKFQAWCKFRGMPRHFAMMKYIEVVEHFMDDNNNNNKGAGGSASASAITDNGVGSGALLDLAMDGDDIVYEDEDEVNFSDDDDVSFASASERESSSSSGRRVVIPTGEISMAARQSTMMTSDHQSAQDNEDYQHFYGESELFQAAGSGNATLLRDLLNSGSGSGSSSSSNNKEDGNDQNVKIEVDERDENGQCPLHLAADQGHLECVQMLLEAGADPNSMDKEGISVLEAAVIGGSLEVVRVLLDVGADPDHKDNDGDTPRTCAEDDENEEMIAILREAPAISIS